MGFRCKRCGRHRQDETANRVITKTRSVGYITWTDRDEKVHNRTLRDGDPSATSHGWEIAEEQLWCSECVEKSNGYTQPSPI